MVDRSVAAGDPFVAGAATRERRALRFFEEHGREIERIGEDTYFVPSQSRPDRYWRVTYGGGGGGAGEGELETCECPDHRFREVACVHILAVGISVAKRRAREHRNFIHAFISDDGEES